MNDHKKTSYLFSLKGGRYILESMRNIVPQVLFGSMWIVFFHRFLSVSNSLERIGLFFLTLFIGIIFFYSVITNLIFLTYPIFREIDQRIQKNYNQENIPEYGWKKIPFFIGLSLEHQTLLCIEILIISIFALIPILLVVISSVNSAEQIYKTLFP